jgi:hypothetical protein
MAKRQRGSPGTVLQDPYLSIVLDLLGPAAGVQLRLASRGVLRAWDEALRRWMRHQLGPQGWLATELDRWWQHAPAGSRQPPPQPPQPPQRRSADLRRILGEVLEDRVIRPLQHTPRLQLRLADGPGEGTGSLLKESGVALADQYRRLLQTVAWPQLWRKAWQVLCWMPAMWSKISYSDGERTLVDERIYVLKSERRVYSYTSETAWDELCRDVLPMEAEFPESYVRIIPCQPHLPTKGRKTRKFQEGVGAFIQSYSTTPSTRLLRLYGQIAQGLPPSRTNLRIGQQYRFHLERTQEVDVLQLFVGEKKPVATLAVRHLPYLRKAPVVRQARLLLVRPKLMREMELLDLCGRTDSCIWCQRPSPCRSREQCHRLYMMEG